ncbi:MAG: hypothetical protein EOP21_02200 [Hyphomicrobiales bacterium]|nr:MAG: hypothetical protein EOP21_02200 [Hyphomicrobiales bacterium]
MKTLSDVPETLDGHEEANELLGNVYAGMAAVGEARRWIAELQREGLAQLAQEVERRLPSCH